MAVQWELKRFKISDLKDYSKNPRKLSKEQYAHLKTSLEKFGLIDKPIVTAEGLIIGGHQRKRVLEKSGIKEIDCYVPDRPLTDKEIEELNIRLNKNTGDWDFDILANQWDVSDLLDWGFTEEELTFFEDDVPLGEEDNQVLEPAKDEDAITKLGDIYELGSHRLICGDSTDRSVCDRLLSGSVPILMVTDPPYGVNYDPIWRKDIKDKHGVAARAIGKVQNDDLIDWSDAYKLFPGNIAYVWHASLHTQEVYTSLIEEGYSIISNIIWVKQHFALSRGDYHWQHEPCWYAVKKGANHNWQGSRDQSTVWEISNLNAFGKNADDERTAHSTQKPIECMAIPIRNNTSKGESVYDPFLGSGTTLIAAEQLDRICYGIEISPAYCDIIVKRWIAYRKKLGKDAIVKKNGVETKEFDSVDK